jgi:hypothetical protein
MIISKFSSIVAVCPRDLPTGTAIAAAISTARGTGAVSTARTNN